MRNKKDNPLLPALLFPLLWSAAFLFASLVPLLSENLSLKYSLILLGAGVWLCWMKQKNSRDKTSVAILLFALLEDYWYWMFFAHYGTALGYSVLIVTEALRLLCLILVVCHLARGKFLNAALICFAVKLLPDLGVAFLRFGYSFTSHPLYFSSPPERFYTGLHTLMQLCLFAFAIAKFKHPGKQGTT